MSKVGDTVVPVLDHITHYHDQNDWAKYQLDTKSGLTQSTISSCQPFRPCSSSSMLYNFLIILSIMFRTCSGSNSPFFFTCKFYMYDVASINKKETRTLIPVSSIHISYHTSSKISEWLVQNWYKLSKIGTKHSVIFWYSIINTV